MQLAKDFPFYESLANSILPGRIDHTPGGPPAGTVVLSQRWSVVVDAAAGEAARLAADDLRRLVAEAWGVSLAEGGAAVPHTVELRLAAAGALAGSSPEAHRISVTPERVVVEGNSGAGVMHGVFQLEDMMREVGGPYLWPGSQERVPLFERRIHRSAVSPFYYEEAAGYSDTPYKLRALYGYDILCPPYREDEGLPAYYAEHVLLGLARHGYNGIWLRGVLRLLSHTALFPDGAAYADTALPRIRELCRRAARYGIHVYMYFNEPIGVPDDDPFWETHPDLRGSLTDLDNLRCLCTSRPEVLDFCREGMRDLFARVPELAGAILITASEFPTHCWSHTHASSREQLQARVDEGLLCPRCAERSPAAIIGEVVTSLNAGMKEASPQAQMMAWNWAWQRYEPDPQAGILAALPADVIVMGDFERGTATRALEVEYENAEYSLKVIGPSPRFLGVVEHQRSRGVATYAKLQLGTTHENPTVPYTPVLLAVGEKYRRLAGLGVAGMMTCWNFGNMPSLATEAANAFAWAPQTGSVEETVRRVASRYFGSAAADAAVRAWGVMHAGMEEAYPGTNPLLYCSPLSRGPAYPWTMERLNRQFPPGWLVVPDAHADDMAGWLSIFGADGVLRCMTALERAWEAGIGLLEGALAATHGSGRRELEREIGLARVFVVQYRSTANTVRFLQARERYYTGADDATRAVALADLETVLREERANAAAALPLVDGDNRLGFHGEAFAYLFDRPLIEAKLRELDEIIDQWLPDARATIRGGKGRA